MRVGDETSEQRVEMQSTGTVRALFKIQLFLNGVYFCMLKSPLLSCSTDCCKKKDMHLLGQFLPWRCSMSYSRVTFLCIL